MKRFLLFLLLISLISNCKKEKVEEVEDPCSCSKGINCTMEYRSVGVTIKNQSGLSISLDNYYTTKILTGEKISLKSSEFDSLRRISGRYPVLGDGQKKLTEKCGTDFKFTGIKNGMEIVKQRYSIGHDCCHVKILSGDPNITIPD